MTNEIPKPIPSMSDASIDPAEIAHFEALATQWWDPHGKFGILHKFNPVRLAFIREMAGAQFGADPKSLRPFEGLTLLDIGCGGGLLSEPMARLGAAVTGVDAAEGNVKTARIHAEQQGLAIDYRAGSAEALARSGARFDIILNMEVIEHVADRQGFLGACGSLLKPGGMMIVATINRTPKAYALAIVAAERILRWVPRGTHDYRKLVTPPELESGLKAAGLTVRNRTGVTYDPLMDRWRLTPDLDVNYMLAAVKAGG
jgi:2-polyprenyl-6-hydroxyphenyl methylase/3-demethylubiquinone-9 3-methyltransferase